MPLSGPSDPRSLLTGLFNAAVSAAHPSVVVPRNLPPPPRGRTLVLGAGKASAAMATALEGVWSGDLTGLVVTRGGYASPTRKIDVVEAGHPVPDERSAKAAAAMMRLASRATADDLVLCLISGGASALAALPRDGVDLEEKRSITRHLLTKGATIDEINCVRKHLSAIKGGQLAAAVGDVPIKSLIISDVVGDDIAVIGSGPTAPDPSTCAMALDVIDRYAAPVSAHIRSQLMAGAWETPKTLPPSVENFLIARPSDGLEAACAFAAHHRMPCLNLGDRFTQSASEIAAAHVRVVEAICRGDGPVKAPCVVISGGEAVVKVTGAGQGGPNTEFALAFALALPSDIKVWALAADTDGTDGVGGHAGGFVTPDTRDRCFARGLDPEQFQSRNDTASLFQHLGDLYAPGPTFTNINDFRAIYIPAI